MPRKNNRDKRFEPRELDINLNQTTSGYDKPRRKKRKDKFDKEIYKQKDD